MTDTLLKIEDLDRRTWWAKAPAYTGAKGQLRMAVAIIPPAKPGRTVCAAGCGCNACSLMGAALAGKINVA